MRGIIVCGWSSAIAARRWRQCFLSQSSVHNSYYFLFGERTAAHDRLFGDELDEWLETGHLQRMDRAFSRDGGQQRYVQDLLVSAAVDLNRWVARGAAIYVCGSRIGMAQAVDTALVRLLGQGAVTDLREQGRYRRDVY